MNTPKTSPYAILQRYADDLALLPLQPRTQKSYWACVRQLSEHVAKSPDLVTPEELRRYFIDLKTKRRFSRQSSTQAICAVKIFWEKTLQRVWPAEVELIRATPQFKLPVVLSASEVRRIATRVEALDHRVALVTIYSCGLPHPPLPLPLVQRPALRPVRAARCRPVAGGAPALPAAHT